MKHSTCLRSIAMAATLLLAGGTIPAAAQRSGDEPGIHRMELEAHRNVLPDTSGERALAPESAPRVVARTSKRVFGYRPYWAPADDYLSYDYNVLNVVAHFGAEVDSATGGLTTLRGWPSVAAIPYARARGVATVLVAISFGYDANDKLLGTPARSAALVDALVQAVKSGGGSGVNVDFEGVRGTQRANLVAFMRALAARMRAEIPGAEISMALPAVDWSNAFDLSALAAICDYVIMMGYDFHYAGSPTSGPIAPLAGESYNVTRSVETYLAAGVPSEKLLLGVPWYGYDWPVVDTVRVASTQGSGTAVFYKNAEPLAAQYGKRFDNATSSPWYVYSSFNGWHQVWYEDSLSLALKYRLVREKNLGGIGIWALSYEGGRREIWSGIAQAFGVVGSVAVRSAPEGLDLKITEGGVMVFLDRPGRLTLRAVDLLGRTVRAMCDERVDAGARGYRLGELPAGAYFIEASFEGRGKALPVVVK